MIKKIGRGLFIILFTTGTVLMAEEIITRPEATSPDGLKVTSFQLRGDFVPKGSILITFLLTNVSDHDITFHPQYGVFVGARKDNQNIDFGHKDKGRTIPPGGIVKMKASSRFSNSGTYYFWPAYNINGKWGPFKWNAITVQIQ